MPPSPAPCGPGPPRGRAWPRPHSPPLVACGALSAGGAPGQQQLVGPVWGVLFFLVVVIV